MAYTHVHYDEVEPKAPGMHFLRDALDCTELGFTVLEAGAGWEGKPHDHGEQGHEEVYLLVEGSGTLTVEDESLALSAGEAVRVDADATRELTFDEQSLMVIAGAP